MRPIVCIEDNGGMMFGGRRLSKDRVLRERLLLLTAGKTLWMSTYSAKQFEEVGEWIVDDDYMAKAGADDYVFVEDQAYSLDDCDELVLYRWNRRYPADTFFDADLTEFALSQTCEFAGYSHETITEEIYRKKGNVR